MTGSCRSRRSRRGSRLPGGRSATTGRRSGSSRRSTPGVPLRGRGAHRPPAASGLALPRLRNAPIGRDADIASVVERIRAAPLLTIIGSGGIGKTTVAVGRRRAHCRRVRRRRRVRRSLAGAATGRRDESRGRGRRGRGRRVGDDRAASPICWRTGRSCSCSTTASTSSSRAAALVNRMLERGDTAHVLATSREPLGVVGEHVWPLGPLHDAGPALFVERARAAEPRVQWDPTDPAVVELCRRLDDVPLALELAAGQLRRFDLDELNRRLDDRLALQWGSAVGRRRSGTPRWRRPSTGATASSTRPSNACSGTSASSRRRSTSDAVEGIGPSAAGRGGRSRCSVNWSTRASSCACPGSGRYRLLETIRVFGRDRLDEAGETTSAFERHRRHVRERIGSTSRLDRWLSARLGAEFRTDLEDARQAFRLSLQRGQRRRRGRDRHRCIVPLAPGVGLCRGRHVDRRARSISRCRVTTRCGCTSSAPTSARDEVTTARCSAPRHRPPASSSSADDPAGACVAAHYGALGAPHRRRPRQAPSRRRARSRSPVGRRVASSR